MAETAQERQENELEALKAIFGAQLISTNECRKKGGGGDWSPLECVLSLGPQQGSCGPQESHAFINIRIVCSADYPEKAPQLFVQESKGLSTVQISKLQDDLKQLTEENRGEVVIYEVAHYIMTYLHRYSRPGFESFYDEMLARKRLQQQREADRRRAVENKKRQEMIQEIQSKQEAMRLENTKRRKNSFIESDSEDESQSPRCKSESPTKKTTQVTAETKKTRETKVKEEPIEKESDSKDEEDFCPWTFTSKGNSRIESEFQVLKWLGEGAFGDVIKARNKLDGCLYAIKRIKLSSTTNVLYRKITREVKLLSRLNHENVVRYFNSWIESASDSTESLRECSPKSEESKMVEMLPKKELTLEWSVGNEGDADASSDDSSDDECWITFMPGVDDSSSSITDKSKSSGREEQPSNGNEMNDGRETENGETREKTDETTTTTNVTPLHFMYIQMEFCEKSTLRNAIDEGLYLEETRVWRLLREIVEGLSHIHGQGIIHRDLKPVNIFIDCDDHVKIGDFGLATSNIFHSALKPPGEQGLLVGLATKTPAISSSTNMGTALTSHTGQVGTALYVAPELNTFGVKASYDQKVDIYSLGVIFFEMCYHPVSTAMERLKILTDLRQPDCIFPSDFLEDKNPEQAHVVRWLLNHDACRRPSSQELLQSPLIPPPQLEDAQLQEMVRHTLSNPQSRAYKHLIAACFSQELSPAQDVTFDMSGGGACRGGAHAAQIELVSEHVRAVLRQHGALYLPMPLLTPATVAAESSVVRLMSRWGGVLAAPYDLRQSFARHLAQNALVTRIKRYAIDRVYRERRVLGFHPRELYECAFDIVTPSSEPATLAAAEAELLFAAKQIVGTRSGSCFIRLNHMCLVRAVLLHCGIDYSSHEKVCSLLAKTKLQEGGSSSRASAESALIGSDLAEQTVAMLLSLLTKEDSYERLSAWLRPLVQKKAKSVCQQGLLHLKQLIEYIGLLGVEWSVVVSLGLIHDLRDYSGVVLQVVWDQRGKHGRTERCVIAAGGRYDSMIHKLRQSLELGLPPDGTQQHAAGISLSLDKLVSVLSSSVECGQKLEARRTVDVIVCAVGSTGESCAQRLKVLKELWAAGISCSSIDEAENNNDDIQSVCFEMGASFVVYLKDGGCRIRNLSKDLSRDKSQQDGWLSQSELVESLQRMMRASLSSSNSSSSLRDSQTRAESRSFSEPSQPPVNVHFDVIDKTFNSAARRRLEIQVLNSVNGMLQKLSGRARVEILVLSLESEAVRLLASLTNVDRAELDPSSAIKRFPRHKKYLERISERVQELTNTVRRSSAPVLVFYSIIDNSFQTVL
ncbi:hypothetical protein LSTR_LSTR008694 [Laodelphax striatellus]|uniref:non-specific serine/threonine protein kinase n=1 Tax=Laodelphax striatellus TaxID=195883 RepID=A0A482WIH8_LAOST|nr:hypothetical protein LSTR_LSTR008694 [Laodelphax striatellus]